MVFPDKALNYLAYLRMFSDGLDVHCPPSDHEMWLQDEGLVSISKKGRRGMYEWCTLAITEFGKQVLSTYPSSKLASSLLEVCHFDAARYWIRRCSKGELAAFFISDYSTIRIAAQQRFRELEEVNNETQQDGA